MRVKTLYLILRTDRNIEESPSKLRGYIANKFGYPILHNHDGDGFLHTYPRIQYKIIEGSAFILGIEEGADVLKEISGEIEELKLGKRNYLVEQKIMFEQKCFIGETKNMINYKFITPWLALNPENYKKYRGMTGWKEKKELLKGILVGNILSMCKGLGVVVNKRIFPYTHLDPEKVEYKNIPMIGFTGRFRINFAIPDFFGLGKGVSQGFGVIKRNKNKRSCRSNSES